MNMINKKKVKKKVVKKKDMGSIVKDMLNNKIYADYFKMYNDLDPNIYCELALTKLRIRRETVLKESKKKYRKITNLLNNQQIDQLNKIIDANCSNNRKWELYCSTLTYQQICTVGW